MIEIIWDSFLTQNGMIIRYDKLEHAVLFAVAVYNASKYFGWHLVKQNIVWFTLGLLNELKDALLSYQEWGWIGGEGFSVPDVIANAIGLAIGTWWVVRKASRIQKWMQP